MATQPDLPANDISATVDDFARLRGWVKNSMDRHAEWYKEARESYEFVAGRQWDEQDKAKLEADGRPPVVFNLIGPTIDAICGMEVNNRQEVKYLPRTMGETQVNERLTSLGQWARDEAQAEDEESAAFRDTLICGRGWVETRIDFECEPTGKIIVERIDPLECGVDPAARKANFVDARYQYRFRDLDTDAAQAMFPGQMWSQIDASWARTIDLQDGGEGNKRDYPNETRAALRDDKRPKTVRVVQIQWWERESALMVVTPDRPDPRQVSSDDWEAEKAHFRVSDDELKKMGVKWQPVTRRTFKQAFLGAMSKLPDENNEVETKIDGFSMVGITGKLDRNKGVHYGIVRPLLDPQRLGNKTLSQTIHILNTNAKGGLLYEKSAFANVRDAESNWSNPGRSIMLNDGALSGKRIQERTAPQMPPVLAALLEFAMTSIRNVTGVNLEILGAADRDQAASLEYQRRQSAMAILAPMFDSLRRYRKTQGHVMIAVLRQLPPGVLVRVVAEDDQQQAQENQQAGAPQQGTQGQPPQPGQQPKNAFMPFDPAQFGLSNEEERFDVIVDESPSSPNQKEQAWTAMQPFVQGLASNPAAIGVLLKYSPLPSTAAQELTAAIQGGGVPPEIQQQMQQGMQRIQELEQENNQLKGDQAAKMSKAQTDQFNAETDRIHKVGQLGAQGGDEGGSEVEMLKLAMEQRFEAAQAAQEQNFQLLLQHLKNAGQIAASRVRADATADQGIETDKEVGA